MSESTLPSVLTVISGRERDLGGFSVRRVLPFVSHRAVGPFVFFDHMGPSVLAPGQGMDVRPHPHIHLATVTYLFEGSIHHRDSVGSDQLIEPGAINWMTAGRGIVHSERTPADVRARGSRLHGIQCWLALPEAHADIPPAFDHHPKTELPEFNVDDVPVRLLLGQALKHTSPVRVHSPLFYFETILGRDQSFTFDGERQEAAVYIAEGDVTSAGQTHTVGNMLILNPGTALTLTARTGARLLWLGGVALGPREMFWNFVSHSKEAIAYAKAQWALGPGAPGSPFARVPGDEHEFIPLPS